MDAPSPEPSTRDKILIAAATMLGENPTARLSVRAVAARAEVSTGSLRHFFPTQRELIDTVIAGMYELDIPDDPIHDRTMSPTDRLIASLQLILAEVGTGENARQYWGSIYQAYIASPPAADESLTYVALERMGRHRIEQWLHILIDEGAIPAGGVEQRAQFLASLLTGILMERALPADAPRAESEAHTLRLAVHAVSTLVP